MPKDIFFQVDEGRKAGQPHYKTPQEKEKKAGRDRNGGE
jgi:hypothetical protein